MPERFDNVYQINNFCLISVIRENAWDRPDSWQPISITMHLYVSRSPADISDDNNNSFDYGRMYRQVKDLVDRRSFHCIDHVGWSLSRLCHAWPVQLVKIKVFTPRRTSRDEGGMKKEWIWLRDKETHHRHFAAQKLIFENLEIDCIIGDNPHERARKQTVRVTIQVDGEDNKPSTCPGLPETGHIDWKGLVGGIYELVEASSCRTMQALAVLIAKFALEEHSLLREIGVHLKKKNAFTLAEDAGVQIWRDSEWLRHLPPESRGTETGRRLRKRKREWISGHYLFG